MQLPFTEAFDQSETDDALQIAGVPVSELVRTYGTPLYVTDATYLERRLAQIRDIFSGECYRAFYSIKANPGRHVLRCCRQHGLGFDACSPGDVLLAEQAGATGEMISYTGVGLTRPEIAALAEKDIWVNLDSRTEVNRWCEVASGRAVGIRVVPEVEAGFHTHCRSGGWGGKFGVPREELDDACALLERHGCSVATLHFHLGSSISTTGPYLEAVDRVLEMASALPTVCNVNIGGGFAARFHPDDADFPMAQLEQQLLPRLLQFSRRHRRPMTLSLEPGEFLVSEAGYLLCQVRVVKRLVRDGRRIVLAIADGGMNLYPAHSMYGSYLHIWVDGKTGKMPREEVDIYGPTNQNGDTLAKQRLLPPLDEGDILVVRNAGAYAFSRSTRFNERPRPGEVWIENGVHFLARQPEGIEVICDG